MYSNEVSLQPPKTESRIEDLVGLRHALYMAVCCAIHDCRKSKTSDEIIPRNKKLREFYDKKRQEGKPFRSGSIKQNVDTHPSPFQHLN